ncbi:MAG: CBS domain-containing protein [Desulfobacterales bacterium]
MKNKDCLKFSRIPICSDNSDNITGYVFRQKVFEKLAEDHHELKLKDIKRNILFLPDKIALFSAWEILLEKKEHIAMIMDEYGGIDGIVTMEDIVETLLGLEIIDEKDTISDMQKYARDRWKTRQTKYKFLEELDQENK